MCFWLLSRSARKDAERMMNAIREGDLAEVQRFVKARPGIVNWGWPPLHNDYPLPKALLLGREEIALYLLAHGASRCKGGSQFGDLLHYAAGSGLTKATEVLIEMGARANSKSLVEGQTPLHMAAHNGHIETAEVLIRHGADVNAEDEGGRTPLREATDMKHHSLAELLVSAGAHS